MTAELGRIARMSSAIPPQYDCGLLEDYGWRQRSISDGKDVMDVYEDLLTGVVRYEIPAGYEDASTVTTD